MFRKLWDSIRGKKDTRIEQRLQGVVEGTSLDRACRIALKYGFRFIWQTPYGEGERRVFQDQAGHLLILQAEPNTLMQIVFAGQTILSDDPGRLETFLSGQRMAEKVAR